MGWWVVPEDFPFEWMNMEDDSSIYDAELMIYDGTSGAVTDQNPDGLMLMW